MKVANLWVYPIILTVQLWQTSALSMNQLCNYWPGTGYIGDISDCQGWGYCKDNKLVAQGSCHEDDFYDALTGTCQTASMVRCGPQYWDLCAKRQKGEYVANSLDCRKYNKCDDEGGVLEVNYCADGYVFSNRLQKCVPSAADECPRDNVNICAYVQGNTTMGNPLNCGSYIECRNGTGRLGVCTAGRYYNYKTGKCQTTRPEHCSTEMDSYMPSRHSPPETDAYICADFYQDDRAGAQFISDALTCYGYYTCSSQYAIGKWHSCPPGTHFQWWSQRCVRPEAYSCPFDRCGNLNSSFVTAVNSGCSEYIYCKNQKSCKLLKCPKEYPYFDEMEGICVDIFTNDAVCFMDD